MTDSMLPNETLQSQLSAFVDDELPQAESDLFVRRLVKDAELKQTMSRYQLIGEAMRAPTTKMHLSRDFSARIEAALDEQDPAQAKAVHKTATSSKFGAQRWLKPVAGMTVAAGVALVAVLAVRTQQSAVGTEGLDAEVLTPVMLTAQKVATTDSYVVPSAANAPTSPIPVARLTNYVVAHSEFSSPLGRRNMLTGLLAGDQSAVAEPVADVEVTREP